MEGNGEGRKGGRAWGVIKGSSVSLRGSADGERQRREG